MKLRRSIRLEKAMPTDLGNSVEVLAATAAAALENPHLLERQCW